MLSASEYFINDIFVFKSIENSNELVIYFNQFEPVKSLQQQIHYTFKNPSLLFNVFSHKSFAHESRFEIQNNERLEFLGDSVLQLIISQELMLKYPNKKEGELSKLRSSIVNTSTLAKLAAFLKLDKLILLGKGEYQEHGQQKESLMANCFEALLGAIYTEAGLEKSINVLFEILAQYQVKTKENIFSDEVLLDFDAKSRLQEIVMKEHKVHPVYQAKEIKQNKKLLFEVSLIIKKQILATITHESKKKAMQLLAKEALKNKLYSKLDNFKGTSC